MRGCEGEQSPDRLRGGYQVLRPGANDKDGGHFAGYRGWYEKGFRRAHPRKARLDVLGSLRGAAFRQSSQDSLRLPVIKRWGRCITVLKQTYRHAVPERRLTHHDAQSGAHQSYRRIHAICPFNQCLKQLNNYMKRTLITSLLAEFCDLF